MYSDYAKIRDSKGFTDYAVAKGASIGRSTLSDWKSGLHVPHIQNLQKIAAFLNVSVGALMPQIQDEDGEVACMTIGERIKNRREELGLTQQELAERLGNKSRASVSTVEHNKEDMTITRIRQYAEALQTTPSYLIGLGEVSNVAEPKNTPQLEQQYFLEVVAEAMKLYEKYKSSPQKIQNAIQVLLKPDQSDP